MPMRRVDAVRTATRLILLLALLGLVLTSTPVGAQGPLGPRLTGVTPNPAPPGSLVRVEGEGLGTPDTGILLLDGRPLDRQDVRSWSDTAVEFRLPARPGTFELSIHALGAPSNPLRIEVADSAGEPVPPARVAASELAEALASGEEPAPVASSAPAPSWEMPEIPTSRPRVQAAPSSLVGDSPSAARGPSPVGSEAMPGRAGTGVLAGKVQDSGGRALAHATIEVDGAPRGRTSGWGEFRVEGLDPGTHRLAVLLSGYKTGQGQVSVPAGGTREILVSLSPTSGRTAPSGTPPVPEERKTKLTIRAYPYRTDGERFIVRRIEVTELGGAGRSWQNTWYRTWDSYVELPCDGAVLGHSYRVSILWYSPRSKREYTSTWEPKVWKEYQQETYYNP